MYKSHLYISVSLEPPRSYVCGKEIHCMPTRLRDISAHTFLSRVIIRYYWYADNIPVELLYIIAH